MKWVTSLLLVASVASAVPRDKKAFSLFSVVTFPNDECTTTMSTSMKGVCQTAEQCGEKGGTSSGNCASGFGVCCFYKVDDCSTKITNNITYIQNTNYPTSYTTASKTCSYKVMGSSSICQIRLDFDNAVFVQPDSNGDCTPAAQDQFTVTSPTTTFAGFNALCGTLTGSHIYAEAGREDPALTVSIKTGTATTARTWKIKVSMIECDNPSKAPESCLQYYTGVGNRVKSFNLSGGQTIKNQEYSVCIRPELGMCSFQVAQSSDETSPDTFKIDDGQSDSETGTQCSLNYLIIYNSKEGGEPRYCGSILAPDDSSTKSGAVSSDVGNFRFGVVSVNTAQPSSAGWDVVYHQRPCK